MEKMETVTKIVEAIKDKEKKKGKKMQHPADLTRDKPTTNDNKFENGSEGGTGTVRTSESKPTTTALAKKFPKSGPELGPKKTDPDKTPAMGTIIGLPKAVKNTTYGSTTSASTTSSTTSTPSRPNIEQARKILKNHEKQNSSSTELTENEKQAKIQEWKGKLKRILSKSPDERTVLQREHVLVSAIAFIPTSARLARIRTIKSVLDISAKEASEIYTSIQNNVPFIEHPELKFNHKSGITQGHQNHVEITRLRTEVDRLKDERKSLDGEIKLMDWELVETRESLHKVCEEAVKVLKFVNGQVETAFDDTPYVDESQFSFLRRVLQGEIKTFTEVCSKALEKLSSNDSASS